MKKSATEVKRWKFAAALIASAFPSILLAQDINFDDLQRQGPGLSKTLTVTGLRAEGSKYLTQFDGIDSGRVEEARARARSYSASSGSTSSGSEPSTDRSKSAGVSSMQQRNYDNAGRNTVGYEVRCDNGKRETIYRSAWDGEGAWYYGAYPLSNHFLSKARTSPESAAKELCQ